MKRITAYARKTVLTSAREYLPSGKAWRGEARKDAIRAAFRDAMHGTDTGWWNELIYNVDVLQLANFYRSDIAACVRDYLSETGEKLSSHCDRDRELTWADVLASTGKRATWADYVGENGRDNETRAMAMAWGIRFAVEYVTGNLAHEYEAD